MRLKKANKAKISKSVVAPRRVSSFSLLQKYSLLRPSRPSSRSQTVTARIDRATSSSRERDRRQRRPTRPPRASASPFARPNLTDKKRKARASREISSRPARVRLDRSRSFVRSRTRKASVVHSNRTVRSSAYIAFVVRSSVVRPSVVILIHHHVIVIVIVSSTHGLGRGGRNILESRIDDDD
jgi:hypothetical protein